MPTRRLAPFVLAALVGGVLASGPASATKQHVARSSFRSLSATGGAPEVLHSPLSNIAPGRLSRLHRQGMGAARRSARPAVAVPHAPTLDPAEGAFNTLAPPTGGIFASPSDSTGAVGPNYYVAAVNVGLGVFDRTAAHTEVLGPLRLKTDLAPGVLGADTDPKVVYDPYSQHFIVVFLMVQLGSAKTTVVVWTIPQATADMMGTWCRRTFHGDLVAGNGQQLADYPGLGFTSDRVTITTNQFAPVTGGFRFAYSQIVSVNTAKLENCSATPKLSVFAGKQTANPDGDQAFTIQPAQTVGGSTPKAQFMASFDFNGHKRASDIVLWRLGEKPSGLTLSKAAFGVGKVAVPPFGQQCGGSLLSPTTWWDTADLRLTGSFYDAGRGALYTANAVRHDFGSGNVSAVRWYEVDPAGSLASSTVPRKGFVGANGTYTAWPSVATDSTGNLFVNYTEASLAECLSFAVADVLPGSTAALRTLVQPGEKRYEFGPGFERWGDYSAENRDPSNPTRVAAFNSYALDNGSVTTDLFQERAALLFES